MSKLHLLITIQGISSFQGLNLGYGNVKIQELNMKGKLSERKPTKTRLPVLSFLALDFIYIF